MKQTVAFLACMLILACRSSNTPAPEAAPTAAKIKVVPPDILFLQLIGPADQNFPAGNMQVKYGMRIANRWSEPITLRSIELSSMGLGGPYILKRDIYFFGKKIQPAQFGDIIWWATAVARGNPFSVDANAPVSVRAVAFFESPKGTFRKVLWRDFGQFGTGARTGN